MSLDVTSIVEWVGHASPAIFIVSALVGVVGSLVSRWYFQRATKDKDLGIEIDELLKELSRQTNKESPKEVQDRYRQVLKRILEVQRKEARTTIALSKLGEYLSNHSPSDSLTRGVGQ